MRSAIDGKLGLLGVVLLLLGTVVLGFGRVRPVIDGNVWLLGATAPVCGAVAFGLGDRLLMRDEISARLARDFRQSDKRSSLVARVLDGNVRLLGATAPAFGTVMFGFGDRLLMRDEISPRFAKDFFQSDKRSSLVDRVLGGIVAVFREIVGALCGTDGRDRLLEITLLLGGVLTWAELRLFRRAERSLRFIDDTLLRDELLVASGLLLTLGDGILLLGVKLDRPTDIPPLDRLVPLPIVARLLTLGEGVLMLGAGVLLLGEGALKLGAGVL